MATEKKEILIERWGIDQYAKWLARRNENIRRRRQGLDPLPKFTPKPLVPPDDIEVKMEINYQYQDTSDLDKFAGQLQKEMQRWWRTETGSTKFILVVDALGKYNSKTAVKLTIDLTQLAMSDEIQDKFKWGSSKFVRDYMHKLNNN